MSKHTLNGSKIKALKKSGFRARMATKTGRNILKQRKLKGRKQLVSIFNWKK